jgi:hypothetical protein
MNMKSFIGFFVILFCITCISCSSKSTRLIVDIAQDPVGGTNVDSLTCTIMGRLADGTHHIIATIEWWWCDTLRQNAQAIAQETYTFTSDLWEEYVTVIGPPEVHMFVQGYWVKVKWDDEDESHYEIDSDTAWCDIQ